MNNSQGICSPSGDVRLHPFAGAAPQTRVLQPREENNNTRQPSSLLVFIEELRRRRVCRATTLYFVAVWVISQVVELLTPPLGLPEWALSLVIVLGLIGFPIAIALSWLFDLTPDGVVVDPGRNSAVAVGAGARSAADQVLDSCLMIVALIIGGYLAFGSTGFEAPATAVPIQRVSIAPFQAARGSDAESFAQILTADVQHEIFSGTSLVVVVPKDADVSSGSVSLTGSVTLYSGQARVTATLVENRSGEVIWSDVFHLAGTDSLPMPAEFARVIVSALPLPHLTANAAGS